MFAHRFDHTNSDSEDFINSEGINSEVDEDGNDQNEEGKLESIFSNKMLSVRVTSANRRKEEKQQTSITLNLSKEKFGGNLETIKENVGVNTLRKPIDSNRETKKEYNLMSMSPSKKDKIVLPTQFNFPNKFYSPNHK